MYLMYVDESGDCGLSTKSSPIFVLSGIVVHELRWQQTLGDLISFRSVLKQNFGLRLRDEFHASKFISRSGEVGQRISKSNRLAMIRLFAGKLAVIPDICIINVLVSKAGKKPQYDVFERAWTALIQRFENTISNHNFPGPANPDERGIVFCDHTDDKKLMLLLRKKRHYNPVPNAQALGSGYRNLPLQYVIEDPSFRDSAHSYFVQAADLAAFLLYQRERPNTYIKMKSGHNYFARLTPVLCRVASPGDPDGIVRL